MENSNELEQAPIEKKKRKTKGCLLILLFLVIFYFLCGFVSIQPIGAIPEGVTLFVNRTGTNLKFFDSPDAMCERTMNGVSLLCRLSALGALADIEDKIISRLPYIRLFYLLSTGGSEYDS